MVYPTNQMSNGSTCYICEISMTAQVVTDDCLDECDNSYFPIEDLPLGLDQLKCPSIVPIRLWTLAGAPTLTKTVSIVTSKSRFGHRK